MKMLIEMIHNLSREVSKACHLLSNRGVATDFSGGGGTNRRQVANLPNIP